MKDIINIVAFIYGIGVILAELYFTWVWVFIGNDSFSEFLVNLVTWVFYGWMVITLQSLVWPLYLMGVLQ